MVFCFFLNHWINKAKVWRTKIPIFVFLWWWQEVISQKYCTEGFDSSSELKDAVDRLSSPLLYCESLSIIPKKWISHLCLNISVSADPRVADFHSLKWLAFSSLLPSGLLLIHTFWDVIFICSVIFISHSVMVLSRPVYLAQVSLLNLRLHCLPPGYHHLGVLHRLTWLQLFHSFHFFSLHIPFPMFLTSPNASYYPLLNHNPGSCPWLFLLIYHHIQSFIKCSLLLLAFCFCFQG